MKAYEWIGLVLDGVNSLERQARLAQEQGRLTHAHECITAARLGVQQVEGMLPQLLQEGSDPAAVLETARTLKHWRQQLQRIEDGLAVAALAERYVPFSLREQERKYS